MGSENTNIGHIGMYWRVFMVDNNGTMGVFLRKQHIHKMMTNIRDDDGNLVHNKLNIFVYLICMHR